MSSKFTQWNGLIVLALLATLVVFTQTALISDLWLYSFDDGTYSHAPLIPLVSVYLYYELSRDKQLQLRHKLSLLSVILLLCTSYLLYVTVTAKFSLGYRLSFLLFICSLIFLCYRQPIKTIFPAFFLIFMMPVWGGLVPILQSISTVVVSFLMSLTSIPIYVEGNVISIPNGVFEIAGGCSGLRYFLVSSAISSLYIYLYIKRVRSAAIFAFAALFGALIVNWIRILALILIGYFTDMESSLMQDHNNFGWFLYLPFMFGLFLLGNVLSRKESADTQDEGDTITAGKFIPSPLILLITLTICISLADNTRKLFYQQSSLLDCQNYTGKHQSINPDLQYVDKVCIRKAHNEDLTIYAFDPTNLDSKPEFYLNTLYDKFSIVERSMSAGKTWSQLIVKHGKNNYFVAYSYNIGDHYTAFRSTHKKNKLLSAAFGINDETFITYETKCDTNCAAELTNFQLELR